MTTYAPGQQLNQSAVEGYVSGRLFEAAIAQVASAAAKGPITTAMVKQGLGRIKHETLDGLAPPLTFHSGKPAPVIDCYYDLQVGSQGFAAPQGSRASCL
jgi:branched-chain amino acid transport system substrate-binding protein